MECKREEAENIRQEASNLNPQLLHEDGDLKVFGNKANDTIRLFIPSGKLPKVIQIGNKYYNTRKILEILEEITEKKIISKRENRAIRHMVNTTLSVGIVNDTPIKIIGKGETLYSILPDFK